MQLCLSIRLVEVMWVRGHERSKAIGQWTMRTLVPVSGKRLSVGLGAEHVERERREVVVVVKQ